MALVTVIPIEQLPLAARVPPVNLIVPPETDKEPPHADFEVEAADTPEGNVAWNLTPDIPMASGLDKVMVRVELAPAYMIPGANDIDIFGAEVGGAEPATAGSAAKMDAGSASTNAAAAKMEIASRRI